MSDEQQLIDDIERVLEETSDYDDPPMAKDEYAESLDRIETLIERYRLLRKSA